MSEASRSQHLVNGCCISTINSHNVYHTDNCIDNRVDNSVHNHTINNQYTYATPLTDEDCRTIQTDTIIEWLSALDFSSQQNDMLAKWQPGTGEWFLQHPAFQDYLKGNDTPILFCHGIPGAGKSVLASRAIEYLSTECEHQQSAAQLDADLGGITAVAYVYCNYKEETQHTATNLTKSILRQLAITGSRPARSGRISEIVLALYQKHQEAKTTPSGMEYAAALRAMIDREKQFAKVFIVIDALDEMADAERHKFMFYIKRLARANPKVIRVLIFSRLITEVSAHFGDCAQLEVIAMEGDIRAFVIAEISQRWDLQVLAPAGTGKEFTEEICNGITERAQGMFLLARFHLDAVATAGSISEARTILRSLPTEIEIAYEHVLQRIKKSSRTIVNLAMAVLTWVVYAFEPLTIKALQHALAIESGGVNSSLQNLHEESLVVEEKIISACAGLVVVDHKSSIVRLVHETVNVFFERKGSQLIHPERHTLMASACMQYLTIHLSRVPRLVDPKTAPLWEYACNHWGNHAQRSPRLKDSPLKDSILNLLELLKQSDEVVAQVKKLSAEHYTSQDLLSMLEREHLPLVLTARFGLVGAAAVLLQRQSTSKAMWSNTARAVLSTYRSPGAAVLEVAIRADHPDMVRLLLDHSDWINPGTGFWVMHAVHWAAKNGHRDIMQLLMFKSNQHKVFKEWALVCAATYDDKSSASTLLSKGVSVVRYWRDRLEDAVSKEKSIRHALDVFGNDMTALEAAVIHGNMDMVRLLLEGLADDAANLPYYRRAMIGIIRFMTGNRRDPPQQVLEVATAMLDLLLPYVMSSCTQANVAVEYILGDVLKVLGNHRQSEFLLSLAETLGRYGAYDKGRLETCQITVSGERVVVMRVRCLRTCTDTC